MDAMDSSRLPVVDNVSAMHTTQLQHQSPQAMTGGATMHAMNSGTMQPTSLQFNGKELSICNALISD
jgi:hypothetical protein